MLELRNICIMQYAVRDILANKPCKTFIKLLKQFVILDHQNENKCHQLFFFLENLMTFYDIFTKEIVTITNHNKSNYYLPWYCVCSTHRYDYNAFG